MTIFKNQKNKNNNSNFLFIFFELTLNYLLIFNLICNLIQSPSPLVKANKLNLYIQINHTYSYYKVKKAISQITRDEIT